MSEKRYPLKLYVTRRPTLILMLLGLFGNAAIWTEIFWNIRPQEESIFLHYNILFGVDLFGPWWKALSLPLGGLLILFINTLIGWLLFDRDPFASYLSQAIAVLCQIFLIVAAFLLVFLNV